ncbi:hypothetical protein OAC17_04830 [Flavobacteriaceae bacterium]|nr:hypothetical protein [Flavobacteriaceae bacterium]
MNLVLYFRYETPVTANGDYLSLLEKTTNPINGLRRLSQKFINLVFSLLNY